MKPYLDTEDTFYFNYEELIKASKIITNLGELIVIALTIYTAWQVVYGQENEVIVTIVKGPADADSGENKYDGEKHSGYGFDRSKSMSAAYYLIL